MSYRSLLFTLLLFAISFHSFSQVKNEEKEVLALKQIKTPSFIIDFEYNNEGYIISETKITYSYEDLSYKYKYEYDEKGNIILLKKYRIEKGDWIFIHQEENEYNDKNQIVIKKIYQDYGTGFKFIERLLYFFQEELLDSLIFQMVSGDGTNFFNNIKHEFAYNKQNLVEKIGQFARVGVNWLYTDIFTFEYDENENILSYSTEFIFDDEFIKNWQYQYHYTEDFELKERSFHRPASTEWSTYPNERYLYFYDDIEEDNPILYPNMYQFDEIDFNWFRQDNKLRKHDYWLADCGGIPYFVESASYEYETIILNPDTVQSVDSYKNIDVLVYPNPTMGKFRVTSLEFRVDKIEIFDLLGRKVEGEGRKQKDNSPPFMEGWQPKADGVVMDIQVLPAGTYLIKIQTEKEVITKKIIKL